MTELNFRSLQNHLPVIEGGLRFMEGEELSFIDPKEILIYVSSCFWGHPREKFKYTSQWYFFFDHVSDCIPFCVFLIIFYLVFVSDNLRQYPAIWLSKSSFVKVLNIFHSLFIDFFSFLLIIQNYIKNYELFFFF